MSARRKITDSEVIAARNAGLTLREAGLKLGVHPAAILKRETLLGLQKRSRKGTPRSAIADEAVREAYNARESQEQTGRRYGMSHQSIAKRQREVGLQPPPIGRKRSQASLDAEEQLMIGDSPAHVSRNMDISYSRVHSIAHELLTQGYRIAWERKSKNKE